MTDQQTIEIISGALQMPFTARYVEEDVLAKLMTKYPYFVPARYVKAHQQYSNDGNLSDSLLSASYAYTGNWIQFWQYAQGILPETSTTRFQYDDATEDVATFDDTVQIQSEAELFITDHESNLVSSHDSYLLDEGTKPAASINTDESALPEGWMPMENNAFEIAPQAEQTWIQTDPNEITGELVTEEHTEELHLENPETPEDIPVYAHPATPENDDNIYSEPIMHETQHQTAAEPMFEPAYIEDYFMQQGIKVSGEMPAQIEELRPKPIDARDRSLMVMMSFTEWLLHFKSASEKQKEEAEGQKAVKTMWQMEKLAAALEEENEEIPENVFEMAVNSITREEGLASESLAEIYIKQQKFEKAVEMYRKLSLRNPQKNAYFAQKIEDILKGRQL